MTVQEELRRFDIELGAEVHRLRRERKISQTALAKKLGVSFQQIQKYERGNNRISVRCLLQIARALDVEVWTFFPGDRSPAGRFAQASVGDQQSRALVEHFCKIKKAKAREQIIELCETLAIEWARTMKARSYA